MIMTKTRNNNNDDNGDLDKVVNEPPSNKKKYKSQYDPDEFEENMLKEKKEEKGRDQNRGREGK
jgi:hypothetical protein